MKRPVAGIVTALLLGACSSGSGAKPQPEDEFLDKVEAVCREASLKIQKLDKSGESAASDVSDIITDAADSLNKLTAPKALAKDYDSYTTNLDGQVTVLHKLVAAQADGDAGGLQAAIDELNNSSFEGDKIVNNLDAVRCRGLIPENGLAVRPDDTLDTTPPTDPPTTESVPIETVVPPTEATTAPTTAPTDTTTPSTLLASQLSDDATAPVGYEWIEYSGSDVTGLYNNSVIGGLVTYYAGGELQSTTDSSVTATVYAVQLSENFTPDYVAAYQFWEDVENGADVTTPGGLVVRQEIGAFPNIDCAVYTAADQGLTICTLTGTDGLSLFDLYLATNPI